MTPFVLDVASAHGLAQLDCTLAGPAIAHAEAVVAALVDAAGAGIGPGRVRLRVASARQEQRVGSGDWGTALAARAAPVIEAPAVPRRVTLQFSTPLRLRTQGHNITPERLAFADVAVSLMRRASALLAQGPGCAPARLGWRALADRARSVRWLDTKLRWDEIERRSERQRANMTLGGVVGIATLDGGDIEPFWPLLWLGQWLHAGKGASFGFGRYAIEPLPGGAS